MVYGAGTFMGVPWDTVIKLFRAQLGDTAYATIQDYANRFIEFLEAEPTLAPDSSQKRYVRGHLDKYYGDMVRQIQNQTTERLREETPDSLDDFQQLLRTVESSVIDRHYGLWRDAEYAEDMDSRAADALKKQYRTLIRRTRESRFVSDLTPSGSRRITRLSGWILSKYAYRRLLAG